MLDLLALSLHIAKKRADRNLILKKILRIHQIVIDRFSHIQGREGGLFERRLEHTAHCIFAGKGIGHTCQSNHREPTTTFLFANYVDICSCNYIGIFIRTQIH